MANRLNQKLRKPAQDKTAPVNYDPLHPASLKKPPFAKYLGLNLSKHFDGLYLCNNPPKGLGLDCMPCRRKNHNDPGVHRNTQWLNFQEPVSLHWTKPRCGFLLYTKKGIHAP